MAARWYVFASEEWLPGIVEALGRAHPEARTSGVGSAAELRTVMRAQAPRHASALVGPVTDGVAPINLAAAIVADGHADETVLACASPSGSLRSRAARAGITRVVDLDHLLEVVRAGDMSRARKAETGAEGSSGPCVPVRAAADEGARPAPGPTGDGAGGLEEPAYDLVPAPAAPVEEHVPPTAADALLALPSVPVGRGPDSAPVLVFASGRGGVGKSLLASMAAARATSWGMRVVALDLDLSSGDLAHHLGVARPSDLSLLARSSVPDASRVHSLATRSGDGPSVLGPCERPEMAERVAPIVSGLIAVLANEFDLVVVDTSTTWTDAVAQAAQACDRLLLVSDDTRPSPASLARVASLAVRLGVARTRIMRVTNRCDPRSRPDVLLHRADVGLETAREFRVLEGGDEAGEFVLAGHVADLATLQGDLPDSVATLLAKVLEEVGRLPDVGDARSSLVASVPRRGRSLFARMREAG